MKLRPFFLAVIAMHAVRADPAEELKGRVAEFLRAGSYAWEVASSPDATKGQPSRSRPAVTGESVMNGPTLAKVRSFSVLVSGTRQAALINRRWCDVDRLPPAERAQVQPDYLGWAVSAACPVPHRILEVLAQEATQVRQEHGALVANIDPARVRDPQVRKALPTSVGEWLVLTLEPATGTEVFFSVEVTRPNPQLPTADTRNRGRPRATLEFWNYNFGQPQVSVPAAAAPLLFSVDQVR